MGDIQGDPRTLLDERYELLRRLGSGGTVDVYLALDQRLSCEVALKLLAPGLAADAGRPAQSHRGVV